MIEEHKVAKGLVQLVTFNSSLALDVYFETIYGKRQL